MARQLDDWSKRKLQFPTRVQESNMSDWDFLRRLAVVNRFDLWVDWSHEKKNWVVHFKRCKEAGDAEMVFQYGPDGDGSMISATPEFNIKDVPTGVEVVWMDKTTRKFESTIITEEHTAEILKIGPGPISGTGVEAQQSMIDGARIRFTAYDQLIETFTDRKFANKKEATEFAERWLNDRSQEFVDMIYVVVGNQKIRTRQVHKLEGLGARLDGFYRVDSVRHLMEAGSVYTTEVKATKILSETLSRLPKLSKKKVKVKEEEQAQTDLQHALNRITTHRGVDTRYMEARSPDEDEVMALWSDQEKKIYKPLTIGFRRLDML